MYVRAINTDGADVMPPLPFDAIPGKGHVITWAEKDWTVTAAPPRWVRLGFPGGVFRWVPTLTVEEAK